VSKPFNHIDIFPNATFEQIKQVLEEIGYHQIKDDGELVYFRKNINDENERPLTVQKTDIIKKLHVYYLSKNNNLPEEFRIKLNESVNK
jgi:hypothetical protein